MAIDLLRELTSLIKRERDALLAEWRSQVRQLPSAPAIDTPTLDDDVPAVIDELAAALQRRSEESIPNMMIEGSPPDHGRQRLRDGFDIAEAVAEYNILRGWLHAPVAASRRVAWMCLCGLRCNATVAAPID